MGLSSITALWLRVQSVLYSHVAKMCIKSTGSFEVSKSKMETSKDKEEIDSSDWSTSLFSEERKKNYVTKMKIDAVQDAMLNAYVDIYITNL